MKLRKIDVEVKIEHEDGSFTNLPVSDSYSEPETWQEVTDSSFLDAETKLRAFQYGLYNIRAGKLRSSSNFGALARKLVDSGVFESTKEALEFIIRRRGEK